MSNYVEVSSVIAIPLDQIKYEQLLHDSEEVNNGKYPGLDVSIKLFILWWFLGPDNMFVDELNKEFCIKLGHHRSIHTWRDLRQTICIIGNYIEEKDTVIPIRVKDIDSGENIVQIEHFRIDE